MLAGFLLLLVLTGEVSPVLSDGEISSGNCSYRDLLRHLKIQDNKLFSMTRPVTHYNNYTEVILDVLIYAILDVKEKEQKFVSYVWIDMFWYDYYISWDPDQFCGIRNITLPTDAVWNPDLTIEEITEKDKASKSIYLVAYSDGKILLRNDMVVISTCRMQVYKFPFDRQSCDLSFKSVIHSMNEIRFVQFSNSSRTAEWSRTMMQTQSEWLFDDMIVSTKTVNNFGILQSMLVCTIVMKRRSVLYIVNFMLPIMLFLSLDLASFLISDSGGEKLSFKVTVLLAVTVMQLILNEILPASSDRIPLIALYCVGIFGLMLMSLLETIVVMYLIRKDSEAQDNEEDKDQSQSEDCGVKPGIVSSHNCFRDVNKLIHCPCPCDVSPGETSSELLPVTREGSSGQLTEESCNPEKLPGEMTGAVKTPAAKKGRKPGYWTRVAQTINKVFFFVYIAGAGLFLGSLFLSWDRTD
ncbi:5-hydroxytryptamine receptor 3A-like [Chelmon rostratus]|uniref:5-hydroxytryptamine receptor 3A-like n=1 Tax=Chelmon rostratus TaxID=109905 RepID=UPI001BECA7D8|nr:5-hydroxytryptamine receptor 3A-like [Chelmon rostratus]